MPRAWKGLLFWVVLAVVGCALVGADTLEGVFDSNRGRGLVLAHAALRSAVVEPLGVPTVAGAIVALCALGAWLTWPRLR